MTDEYIKRQNAIDLIERIPALQNKPNLKMLCLEWIKSVPTEDVAQIVRCKDCDHYYRGSLISCGIHVMSVEDDDYCSFGEMTIAHGEDLCNR